MGPKFGFSGTNAKNTYKSKKTWVLTSLPLVAMKPDFQSGTVAHEIESQ